MGGDFTSVEDFVERTHHIVNKASTDILINVGAFDYLFDQTQIMTDKSTYSKNINYLYQKYEKKVENESSFSLFSSDEIEAATTDKLTIYPPISLEEDFKKEVELLGFYLTQKIFSNLSKTHGVLSKYSHSLQEKLNAGVVVSLVGYVSEIYVQISDNKNRSWSKFLLHTEQESIPFFVFGEKASQIRDSLQNDTFVYIKAQIVEDTKKNQRNYDILNISPLKTSKPLHGELSIVLKSEVASAQHIELLNSLKTISQEDYRENAHHKIKFILLNETGSTSLIANNVYRVLYPSEKLHELLSDPMIVSYWVS